MGPWEYGLGLLRPDPPLVFLCFLSCHGQVSSARMLCLSPSTLWTETSTHCESIQAFPSWSWCRTLCLSFGTSMCHQKKLRQSKTNQVVFHQELMKALLVCHRLWSYLAIMIHFHMRPNKSGQAKIPTQTRATVTNIGSTNKTFPEMGKHVFLWIHSLLRNKIY